ncbi:uncharacterized protein J4E78_007179 [Alternaria triticimaculans]|uniref:uncharacterized protein n=1 Tax=Alternaria triticimaculans TaxID=297637 RepID=UPI0020C43FD3|nr:uncharacterized protein J4E78_007179 [Alternaria triticimaculans]KAI4654999.1 hypothetical protein J4E78_007179 [Alternaria triticimaculans]
MSGSFLGRELDMGSLTRTVGSSAAERKPDLGILPKVTPWLEDISTDLSLIRQYDWLFEEEPLFRGVLVAIYAGIIRLWSRAIASLARNREVPTMLKEFDEALAAITKEIERVKHGGRAAQDRRFAISQSNLLNDDASNSGAPRAQKFQAAANPKVPLDNIPYPRNPYFSGRTALLEEIKAELVPQNDPQEIKCCLLSGPAGIGKTQLASQYAMGRKDLAFAKDPKAEAVILWIECENDIQLGESLRETVTQVGLTEDAEGTAVEKCRLMLYRWLKTTGERHPNAINQMKLTVKEHKWLIVLDNVEEETVLRSIWPHGLRGAVLVTSKHPMLAPDLTGDAIEVPKFSDEEGSAFLQKVLARKEYSGEELKSAKLLSQEIGGLPLALQLLSKQVKSQGGKIGRFLQSYQRDPRRQHEQSNKRATDVFYNKSLENAWSTSFDPLTKDEKSLTLMAILCCLGAEHIPKDLFDYEDREASDLGEFSSELEFCHDAADFGDALEPIMSSSMISVDANDDFMSMHRMIQSSFCDWHTKNDSLRKPLLQAAKLLFEAFPEHKLGISLRDQYLMENNFWTECRQVIVEAETICKDHESLAYAHICNTAAIIEYERGHAADAWPYMKKALAIREAQWPSDHHGHCDTLTNHALLLMTENLSPAKFQEAEALLRKVIELAKPHHDELHSVLHHHYTNLGVCLLQQGKYDEAMEWVKKGMDNANNEHFEAVDRLNRTLDLCRVAEKNKGDAGDTARVMRKLAEALELAGDKTGRFKRLEAEAVRRKLQGSRAEELGDTERSYNMLVFVAFW